MGKTYKDTANYFRFHNRKDEAPAKVKAKIDILETDENAGLRHGNNRKVYAEAKVNDRRAERRKAKRENLLDE